MLKKEKKILIVDDQFGIRSLLNLALADYQVKEAVNGQQAVEIAKEWIPDLIIIDMKMPGLSGIDTIKKINDLNFFPKVILMTGYNGGEVTQDLPMAGFISKPFDLDELINLVEEILQENSY